jgi:hypothetical protein
MWRAVSKVRVIVVYHFLPTPSSPMGALHSQRPIAAESEAYILNPQSRVLRKEVPQHAP